jgi:hypothetical protein
MSSRDRANSVFISTFLLVFEQQQKTETWESETRKRRLLEKHRSHSHTCIISLFCEIQHVFLFINQQSNIYLQNKKLIYTRLLKKKAITSTKNSWCCETAGRGLFGGRAAWVELRTRQEDGLNLLHETTGSTLHNICGTQNSSLD